MVCPSVIRKSISGGHTPTTLETFFLLWSWILLYDLIGWRSISSRHVKYLGQGSRQSTVSIASRQTHAMDRLLCQNHKVIGTLLSFVRSSDLNVALICMMCFARLHAQLGPKVLTPITSIEAKWNSLALSNDQFKQLVKIGRFTGNIQWIQFFAIGCCSLSQVCNNNNNN